MAGLGGQQGGRERLLLGMNVIIYCSLRRVRLGRYPFAAEKRRTSAVAFERQLPTLHGV
jgi:hypothetical protein